MSCTKNKNIEIPVTNCVDCMPSPECTDGEKCEEIVDAGCVEYTDEDLPKINVESGDRLNDILRKLNLDADSKSVITNDTNTVEFHGNGLESNPLKADVRIDPDPENIIDKTENGIIAKIDKSRIMTILEMIRDDDDLREVFCSIIGMCATCSITTDVEVEMS